MIPPTSLKTDKNSTAQKLISRIASAKAKGNLIDVSNLKANGTGARAVPGTKTSSFQKIDPGVVAQANSPGIAVYRDLIGVCPEGSTRRFRQAHIRKDGTKVKASSYCEKARSKKSNEDGDDDDQIGPLREGRLGRYGYRAKMGNRIVPEEERQVALRKAVKDLGAGTVVKMLNAVAILQKNQNPEVANIFEVDKQWVKNNFE